MTRAPTPRGGVAPDRTRSHMMGPEVEHLSGKPKDETRHAGSVSPAHRLD
jgi:hypothetical protein